jgi:hypothetical protein
VIANDSTNINKTDNHLSLKIKTTTTYDVRNPGPGLEQTQTCGDVKLLIGIPTHVSIFLLKKLVYSRWMLFRVYNYLKKVWRYHRGNLKQAVNLRRKDSAMAKRKRTNSDLQSITQKTDNEQHEHHQQRRWTQGLWKGKQFLLHMWHRRVSLVTNSVINHETENYRIVEHIHCHL